MNPKLLCASAWLMALHVCCVNDPGTIRRITSREDPSREEGTGVTLIYSKEGHIQAHLEAPLMVRLTREKEAITELPSGLVLRFFDPSMQEESRLTAHYGVVYENSDEMIARNNVVATNKNGDKLETEELIWNQKTRRIYSDKFVRITTADEIMFGDGFESNEDLTNYTIRKIRGTVRLKENL
ncbi:MAG: LPS export ABC transporter periplasmic protein LptC [Chitinophagales bacterium]|nr:LPS export ABC transporter periplasmic protein LptC [Chitinophagales bacterium]MDW8393988.1 LPS export ABC transporter periplasmic protein LptC [Chitinophagales bacterium]